MRVARFYVHPRTFFERHASSAFEVPLCVIDGLAFPSRSPRGEPKQIHVEGTAARARYDILCLRAQKEEKNDALRTIPGPTDVNQTALVGTLHEVLAVEVPAPAVKVPAVEVPAPSVEVPAVEVPAAGEAEGEVVVLGRAAGGGSPTCNCTR